FRGYDDSFHEIINVPHRTWGVWFKGSNTLHYQGDTVALNKFLEGLAGLPGARLTVVLHADAGRSRASPPDSFGPKEPPDWTVSFSEEGCSIPEARPYRFRVNVFLGGGTIRLSELAVPVSAMVEAGGEIGE